MKCDKLMKEAFEGIEFRYKLDDTLEELGNQKLSSKQLEGFLVGKGVSPKEIKQSGVLKYLEISESTLSKYRATGELREGYHFHRELKGSKTIITYVSGAIEEFKKEKTK